MVRKYGYPRMYQTGGQVPSVPYVSLYDPSEIDRYSQALAGMQQRYDTSQSALAKYLDEYAGANIHGEYLQDVDRIVQEKLDNITKSVETDYGGDYGAAANKIIRDLSLARKPVQQAIQATKAREDASKLYQQGAMSGNINRIYDPSTGKFRQLTFDEIAGRDKIFDESGRFTGIPDYMGRFRGAGQHSEFIKDDFSRALQDMVKSSPPSVYTAKIGEFLKESKTKGVTDEDVDNLLWDDKNAGVMSEVGKSYLQSFIGGSKFAAEEFANATPQQVLDYVGNTIKSQTTRSEMSDYKQIRQPKGSGSGADAELTAQIFSPATQTRYDENPYVQEVGSYEETLNPSRLSRIFYGTGFRPGEGGVEDINEAINHMEDYLEKTKNTLPSDLWNKYKSDYDKYKSVQNDLNIAEEALKNSIARSLGKGNDFEKLNEEDKKLINSKMPKSSLELARLLDSDKKLLTQSSSTSRTILHPVTQKKVKEFIVNNIENANFSGSRATASSYFNDVMDKFGVDDPQYVRNYINKNNIIPSYHSSRGEYYIDIPTNYDSKGDAKSDDPEYKRLYFTLGTKNENTRNVLKSMTSAISGRSKTPVTVSDNMKFNFQYDPSKNTLGSNKTEPKIKVLDLNNNPVLDQNNNEVYISLQDLQDNMEKAQTIYLAEEFTKTHMPLSDQKKDPTFIEYEE